jgi:hypothetical protein
MNPDTSPTEAMLLFTAPTGGLAANDANNKAREKIIVDILNKAAYTEHPDFAPLVTGLYAWLSVKKYELLTDSQVPIHAVTRGGRKYNWDFDLYMGETVLKMEWKFGAVSVDSLPEFFNPAANKDFHQGESYAQFFYRGYLPQVCAIYGVTHTMTEAEYVTRVHGTSKAPPLFNALYNAEANGTGEQKKEKKALVDASIAAWLTEVKDKTDIQAITEAFQSSQAGKEFLLYKDGTFYSDRIAAEELIITGVKEVRLGKYLVLQSASPGTTHEMLLRWKNHAGILYPAWQISMKRC